MINKLWMSLTIAFVLIGSGCGSEKQTGDIADLLPTELTGVNATRSTDVQKYTDEQLGLYIGDEAGLYQSFGFVEAATADYVSGDAELTIDIYRFNSPANAKGLFGEIRPEESQPLTIGTEGVASLENVLLVKGNYVVNIDTYDESPATSVKLAKVAAAIGLLLPD